MGKRNQKVSSKLPSFEIVQPHAAALVESLRAFGYSLPAAISDLVDNSITAGSKNIWIQFEWNGSDSFISIVDDGQGMTAKELTNAMRAGSRNPLETRSPTDLGRFGLGLKTASFSQCRKVTVSSRRQGGRSSSRCWDLDYVNQTGEWRLLTQLHSTAADRLKPWQNQECGTIVLWEAMDRVVADLSTDNQLDQQQFLELVDDVESHLAMVFHRFLSGTRPIRVYINGCEERHRVKPWNPFLDDHIACQEFQAERIIFGNAAVDVTGFVLPHHDKLTREEFERAAGPNGWNAHQGFYVYRNKRLLVPGDWLGFRFAKEEHYKLARIRIDIPNTIDGEWNIDVKKSHANPPSAIRPSLKRIASVVRKRAVEVYRHRGKTLAREMSEPHVYLWKPVKRGKKNFYAVNRDHPLVAKALQGSKSERNAVKALLRLLEETVPVEQIWLDKSNSPEGHGRPFDSVSEKDLIEVMTQVFVVLRHEGFSVQEARKRVLAMEAFADFPEIVATLADSNE